MKPEFALSLSFDGIGLLLRDPRGWLRVGEVSLHVSDLKAELADLRRAAEGLAPGGFTTKLIIPDDQIRYLELDTGEVDDALRARIIRDSLDGATPYPVADLVFDFAVDGPTTRVAAVARETLQEAETFALDHGFRPVCFVATPQSARFGSEVFFGETQAAEELLSDGVRPERDAEPVEIVGNAPPPPPEPEEKRAEEARTAAPPAPPAPAPPAAPATVEVDPRPEAAPEAAGDAPQGEPETPDTDTSAAEEPDPTSREASAEQPQETEIPPQAPPSPAPATAATVEDDPPRTATATEPADEAGDAPGDPGPPPLSFTSVRARREPALRREPPLTAPRPQAPDGAPPPLRATRSPEPPAAAAPVAPPAADPAGRAVATPAAEPIDPGESAEPGAASRLGGFLSRRSRKDLREDAAQAAPTPDAAPSADAGSPTPRPRLAALLARKEPTAAAEPETDVAPPFTAPEPAEPERQPTSARIAELLARRREDKTDPREEEESPPSRFSGRPGAAAATLTAKPKRDARLSAQEDEAQRMTIFGARREAQEIGGKPRFLGLMLTVALLVLLAGVAAFAAIFTEGGLTRLVPGRDAPAVTTLPEPDTQGGPVDRIELADPQATPPTGTGDDSAPQADPAPGTPSEAPETVALRPAPLPSPEPEASATGEELPRQPTPEEAQARYAATGIWQMAPARPDLPELIGKEGLVLTSIERNAPGFRQEALARPRERTGDRPLRAQSSPPPAGSRFNLDSEGLVVPTPDGAVTPQGVIVYRGKPDVVPPPRPGSPDAAAEAAQAADEDSGQDTAADATPRQPDIPRLRPQIRPAGLAPEPDPPAEDAATGTADAEAPAATADALEETAPTDAQPGVLVNASLPGPRPRARPDTVLARAEPAAAPAPETVDTSAAVAAALAAAQDEAEAEAEAEAEIDDLESASPLAVASSLAPPARPRDFAQQVEEAQQEIRTASAAAVAPRSVAPSVPSNASVARQATVENALNLRRVNLIGVYGQPSNRRALVRLPNGRYQKVQVGDRLDGGRIAAIGEDELRYTKNGRSLVLRMPSG